jgi:cytochrome c oxidase cbb3-type subunit III
VSEFASEIWDVYVGVLTVLSILACALLLWMQGAHKTAGTETSGHVWDEDLEEYNNPMPRWWMWLFYLTIAFGLAYLVLYPGLGSFKGTLGWSQLGQLAEENARAQAQYGPMYERFAAQEPAVLASDRAALAVGEKLFLNNCAQCHASDGRGSRGYPNLADRDWLWGGSPEAIKASITEGRTGTMPPMGAALGEQGVKDAAHYVMSLSGGAHDSIRRARGEALYKNTCAACHGAEGKGNQALGAPNLADKIWLHGSGEEVSQTIARGRTNQMPAHKDLLSPAKINLLTAYVLSLSAPPPK